MNKYEEALDVIARYISDSKCGITRYSEIVIGEKLRYLQELVDKATPKKATTKDEFRPEYDLDTSAIVDGEIVTNYHCPACGNWLSCELALEPDELDVHCNNCGQYVKGVETDE